MKADNTEAMARIQQSIDSIEKRMRVDSNDLDYETHLRQKRQLPYSWLYTEGWADRNGKRYAKKEPRVREEAIVVRQ